MVDDAPAPATNADGSPVQSTESNANVVSLSLFAMFVNVVLFALKWLTLEKKWKKKHNFKKQKKNLILNTNIVSNTYYH